MDWLLLGTVLTACYALWLPFLNTPLYPDQAVFNYQAARWRRGFVPYRDVQTNLGIGLLSIVAAIQWLARKSMYGYVALVAAYSTASVFFVYLIGLQLHSPAVAVAAALFYGFYAIAPHIEGFTANQETFMNLPMTAGVYVLLVAFNSETPELAGIAGALFTLTILVKPVAGFAVLLLHGWTFGVLGPAGIGWMIVGDVCLLAMPLSYLLAVGGWIGVKRNFLFHNIFGLRGDGAWQEARPILGIGVALESLPAADAAGAGAAANFGCRGGHSSRGSHRGCSSDAEHRLGVGVLGRNEFQPAIQPLLSRPDGAATGATRRIWPGSDYLVSC